MSSDRPLVSVLIPIYNSARFLPACLASVSAQTYTNLEVILIDDCSTDGSAQIARDFAATDQRARAWINTVNVGSRENFKSCLTNARGEYVKYLCGDDLLEPSAIEIMVGVAEQRKDIALVSSRRYQVDDQDNVLGDMPFLVTDAPVMVLDGWVAGSFLLRQGVNWIGEPSTVLFRRHLLDMDRMYAIGGRAPARNLDIVWWLNLMAGRTMAYVSQSLSSFRIHPGQQSQRGDLQGDLVLSWYDIIVGARQVGYLSETEDEIQALAALDGLIRSRLPAEVLHGRRGSKVLEALATRLAELTSPPSRQLNSSASR